MSPVWLYKLNDKLEEMFRSVNAGRKQCKALTSRVLFDVFPLQAESSMKDKLKVHGNKPYNKPAGDAQET